MPKDAKKNVDRYKIRGGDLNEYEFSQNQARVKESFPGSTNSPMPMKGPTTKGPMAEAEQTTAERSAEKTAKKPVTTKKAAKKTTATKSAKKATKTAKKTAKKSTKKSAKKK